MALIDALEESVVSATRPDLTLVFDLDPEQGLLRARSRGDSEDRYERKGLDFHRRLRSGFLEILDREPNRCRLVDAGRPVDDVSEQIWSIVSERI